MKHGRWTWRVRGNEIAIASSGRDSFILTLNGENIGEYVNAEAALEEAVRGDHRIVPSGLRTTDLAPSDNLQDWPFTESPSDKPTL